MGRAQERFDVIAGGDRELAIRVLDFHIAKLDRDIVARLTGVEAAPAIDATRWAAIIKKAKDGKLSVASDITERESLAIDNSQRLTDELSTALEQGWG